MGRIHVLAQLTKHSGIQFPTFDMVDDADHSSKGNFERSRKCFGGKQLDGQAMCCNDTWFARWELRPRADSKKHCPRESSPEGIWTPWS